MSNLMKPYITLPYINCGLIGIDTCSTGNLYNPHEYFSGIPLTKLRQFTAPETPSAEGFILGQYVSTTVKYVVPRDASEDALTKSLDLLYQYLCDEQPELAYVCMQAYSLMSRIASEAPVFKGGNVEAIGVKAYAL